MPATTTVLHLPAGPHGTRMADGPSWCLSTVTAKLSAALCVAPTSWQPRFSSCEFKTNSQTPHSFPPSQGLEHNPNTHVYRKWHPQWADTSKHESTQPPQAPASWPLGHICHDMDPSRKRVGALPQQKDTNTCIPTSIKKSPVLSPACHATPPSSTDSKYCRAGNAGVGVNSSMGVSAGKAKTPGYKPGRASQVGSPTPTGPREKDPCVSWWRWAVQASTPLGRDGHSSHRSAPM